MLLEKEINIFNKHREDDSKFGCKQLQRVYMAHNPSHEENCMCKKLQRKIWHKVFIEWYDKTRD